MYVKVRGGTMSDGANSLCSTCSRSTITRGRSLDEEIVDCQMVGIGHRRITFRVTSCSGYVDARLPSLMQLMENAWVLRRASKRRPAGFIHGKDLREEEMANLMGMDDDEEKDEEEDEDDE